MTTVGVPHSLAWTALAPELRGLSAMPRHGKRTPVGVYARFIEVVGGRALAVSPPGGGRTSPCAGTWQRIGQRLRWYCEDSYTAAYDAGCRIAGGGDVEIELARFATRVAMYPVTAWVKLGTTWVAAERADAMAADQAAAAARTSSWRGPHATTDGRPWTANLTAALAVDADVEAMVRAPRDAARIDVESRARAESLADWNAAGQALLDLNGLRFQQLLDLVREAAGKAISGVAVPVCAGPGAWTPPGRGSA